MSLRSLEAAGAGASFSKKQTGERDTKEMLGSDKLSHNYELWTPQATEHDALSVMRFCVALLEWQSPSLPHRLKCPLRVCKKQS